jgi:hypothetical protein
MVSPVAAVEGSAVTQPLDDWAAEEKARIDRFVVWWKDFKDTEQFPPQMPPGEWDEQYRCWAEE